MNRPNTIALLWIVSLMLFPCACAAGRQVETRTVWDSGDGYIRLFREVGRADLYDHPHPFHEADMARILGSVWFSTNRFFRWSASMRVFEDDQAAALAPWLQRAFLQAGPEELVEFYLSQTQRGLLGVSGQTFLTRGRAFVRDRRLHLHFDNVRQKVRSYSTHAEDQKPLTPSAWRMVPRDGQSFGVEAPSGRLKAENPRWLSIDLAAHIMTPPAPHTPSAPSSALHHAVPPPEMLPLSGDAGNETVPTPDEGMPAPIFRVRETLRELKAMREEGLISPEDYARKKRELLDRL
jgi:hypothetical protein